MEKLHFVLYTENAYLELEVDADHHYQKEIQEIAAHFFKSCVLLEPCSATEADSTTDTAESTDSERPDEPVETQPAPSDEAPHHCIASGSASEPVTKYMFCKKKAYITYSSALEHVYNCHILSYCSCFLC